MHATPCMAEERALQVDAEDFGGLTSWRRLILRAGYDTRRCPRGCGMFHRVGAETVVATNGCGAMARDAAVTASMASGRRLHHVMPARAMNMDIHESGSHDHLACDDSCAFGGHAISSRWPIGGDPAFLDEDHGSPNSSCGVRIRFAWMAFVVTFDSSYSNLQGNLQSGLASVCRFATIRMSTIREEKCQTRRTS